MRRYGWNLVVAASQLLNALAGGHPAETLCSRLYRSGGKLSFVVERLWPGHLRKSRWASVTSATDFVRQRAPKGQSRTQRRSRT